MGTNQTLLVVILFLTGVIFSVGALFYRIAAIQRIDSLFFNYLYTKLTRTVPLFRFIWPLGKTPFLIIVLTLLLLSGGTNGLYAVTIYIVIACIERLFKLTMGRERPFSVLPDVKVFQSKKPLDPSHPSGDTMRVWYLSFVVPAVFFLPVLFVVFFCGLASLVSLGRIVLGVHFPLDVIGGMGLGLFGAGLFIFI